MGVQASNKTGLEGLERRGQSGSPELNERRIFGWRGQMGNEYAVKAIPRDAHSSCSTRLATSGSLWLCTTAGLRSPSEL